MHWKPGKADEVNPTRQVIESYSVCYPNPIKIKAGDRVTIEKWETNPDWKGWAFCVDQRGIKGWVSEKYLRIDGNSATVLRNYDATELDVKSGESVRVHFEEFGWAWVENANGSQGWVPIKNLSDARSAKTDSQYQAELRESVCYLNSDEAIKSLEADAYWPKWDSPWWHMLLLHEMGETKLIPEAVVKAHVTTLAKMPVKIFPIHPGEMPADVDPYRGSPCHCQLGNVYQVLAAWGVDVDRELPWIRPWFLRYQMEDGGLNCDSDAYLAKDEIPSSMVGTIAAFEAILLYTPRSWTAEERTFLDKGANFLIERKLMLGSTTKHNASERESAANWLKACFPRFYLYDVLRGLNSLSIWAEKTDRTIPAESVRDVVAYLSKRFPDGSVQNERHSYEGVGTILPAPSGEWIRRQPATFFPLLARVSAVGEVSPFLSRQWAEARERLRRHPGLRADLEAQ